jgi:hypothetical protein
MKIPKITIPNFQYPEIAFETVRKLLTYFGAIAVFDFVSTLHWYMIVPSLVTLAVMFYVHYRFEIGYRTRRMERVGY